MTDGVVMRPVTPGPQGPPGTSSAVYHHSQGVAATIWTINHMLGRNPGGITALDTANDEIEGSVHIVDANTLTITFATATSGTADLT